MPETGNYINGSDILLKVDGKAFKRGEDAKPYVKGKFVIASIEETSPATDDATYSLSLENDGEPEVYPGKAGSAVVSK